MSYTEAHMLERLEQKLNGKRVLLVTQTGSRLYGTQHAESDWDYTAVTLTGKGKQTVVDGLDVNVMNLTTFLDLVNRSVPNALEALWSPTKVTDPAYTALFNALAPSPYVAKYAMLAEHHGNTPAHKRNQHTVRLAYQYVTMAAYGKFNPRLVNPAALEMVKSAAYNPAKAEAVREWAHTVTPGENRVAEMLERFAA